MNLPLQVESKDYSRGLQLLTALYFWLFMVIFTLLIPLGLYRHSPVVTASLLLLLAIGGSFYAVTRSARELPSLWGIVYVLLFQWGVAALWAMTNRAEAGKLLLSPGRIISQYPEWWIPAVITWLGAQGLGGLIYGLQLRPRRPTYSWDNQWDEDAVDMTYWNRKWWGLQVFTIGLLGIGVLGLAISPNLAGLGRLLPWDLGRILLWLLNCTGLSLLTAGNYCYKRAFWHEEGLAIEASLRREWRGQTGKILFFLSVLTWLLPGNFRAVGWKAILWLINRSGPLPETRWQGMVAEAPGGSSYQPEIPIDAEVSPSLLEKTFFWLNATALLLLAVMLSGVILVFVGYLLYQSTEGQLESLRGLPKALVRFYLFFQRLWQRRQKTGLRRRVELSPLEGEPTNGAQRRKKFYSWGRGSRAFIRRGYYHLLMKARQQGLSWQASQTPEEIGQALAAMLPEETEAVRLVTTGYQEARYGPVDPPKAKMWRFERWRRVLEKRLGRERQGE